MSTFTVYRPIDTSIHEIAKLIQMLRQDGFRFDDLTVQDQTGIITFKRGEEHGRRSEETPPPQG